MSALSDRVVIVTGATSGIGRATALELARRNARVVFTGRRKDRLDDLEKQIVRAGGHGKPVRCDVSKREEVFHAAEIARATFGPIDVLINNAGVMPLSFFDKVDTDGWDAMIDTNIKGVLYGVASVLPEMIKRKRGHIVNVSSIAGRRVFPGGAVYSATKFAVHALTEGLRQEVAEHDIRVTCIAPGFVETELQSHVTEERILERWRNTVPAITPLQSEDIAASIVHALEAPPHVGYNELVIRPTKQQP